MPISVIYIRHRDKRGLLLLRQKTWGTQRLLRQGRGIRAKQEETETDSPRSSTLERGASLLLFGNRPHADRSPRVPTGWPGPNVPTAIGFHVQRGDSPAPPRGDLSAASARSRDSYLFVFRDRASSARPANFSPSLSFSRGRKPGSPRARARCNATGATLQRVERKVVD